jgi:type IV pilus assembly protein PilM
MQNPFGRLGELVSSVVKPGSESVIGVDPGSAYLKVVQLRRKGGRAVLETYGALALGPYAGQEVGRATRLPAHVLAEALRDLMREAHVTTALAMPALPQKELSAAVPIEARKHVPVPISEVTLDWWIIPPEPKQEASAAPAEAGEGETLASAEKGKIEVLIAAIHNEAMTRFGDTVKQAALLPRFFEIELFSTIRALFPRDLLPHAVLDLGASETKLYVVDRGLLRFSHIVSQGAQDLTLALAHSLSLPPEEAEKRKRRVGLASGNGDAAVRNALLGILDFVFAEATQGLRQFQSRFGRPVSDMTLSGGGANLIGIDAYAASQFSVPVRRADPFSQVEAPAFLHEVLAAAGPEFSVALGAAFRALEEGE